MPYLKPGQSWPMVEIRRLSSICAGSTSNAARLGQVK
jgi:hypothetical protein